MRLVFGLGNPGRRFLNSRHNLGASVVKNFAKKFKIKLKRDKLLNSLIGRKKNKDKDLVLAIPLKFMNISGEVLKEIVEHFSINLKDILVVSDDIDLEKGKIRFRVTGSDGGHRGLRSIIVNLKTKNFSRLRIGIGRPPERISPTDYVLGKFSESEFKEIKDAIKKAMLSIEDWLEKD